ncbi:LacI family transcriptional regulator [Jiangella rhizosphaerae]|uniref:LacI family transcriptional regulator n=1 Tax=Jiangella rhizosphaerae TaxID=2293569 RepID=A0A418KN06_9ACTN|nr:LacI family transcriptional regulator [Jiangella rhizosphaerae]
MRTRRVTQREIARIAGVSQATVSAVLNGSTSATVRIPPATRERVQRALEQARYVADPAARRLAGLGNKILGVFTYEPAMSVETVDFYGPLLTGIEESAERLGCDLLFLTASPVVGGRRRLLDRRTRFRLADGCLLLGQDMDEQEVAELVAEGYPCVAVGRREEPSIPYVGVDYGALTLELLTRARALGHRRATYLHADRQTPSALDRVEALGRATAGGVLDVRTEIVTDDDLERAARDAAGRGETLVLCENAFTAARVGSALVDDDTVSVAALGETEGHAVAGRQVSGFRLPRTRMAHEALTLLHRIIDGEAAPAKRHRLLPGRVEPGETLRAADGASR